MIYIISVIALACFGGFHMWAKCLAGLLIAVALLNETLKGKQKIRIKQYTPVILLFLMLIASFWAVDWTKNIEGIITGLVIVGWMILCRYTDEKKKDAIWKWMPVAGAIMTIVSLTGRVASLPIQLWQADRLGGLFQYSNTCALFYLICLMAESDGNKWVSEVKTKSAKRRNAKAAKGKNAKDNSAVINGTKTNLMSNPGCWIHIGLLIINLTGLLLTGARSVMLLLFVWLIYKAVKDKGQRVIYGTGLGVSLAGIVAFALLGLGNQNISRLTTLFTSNSTVWGRLLYYIDGLKILITHPFGMGYMGYYYVQGSMQTGVYKTMFVHNDFLQMGLDYGIVAMLLFVAFIVLQIARGKQSRLNKEIMTAVSVAGLMDFHLQYLVIVMILVLCMDTDLDFGVYEICRNKVFNKNSDSTSKDLGKTGKKNGKTQSAETAGIIIFGMAVLMSAYCLMVYASLASGNYEAATKMFPASTTALENIMLESDSSSEVMILSEKILSTNRYNMAALNYRAYASITQGDYKEAVQCENRAIQYDRYNVEQYQIYDGMISDMMTVLDVGSKNTEFAELLEQEKQLLPERLKKLESETSWLAYKIKDKPVFEY